MSALAEILERRARLVAEAEAQRRELTEGLAGCRGVLAVVDRGIAWASWLRARPYLVVIAATAIALLRPKLALGWSARLIMLWRVGRFLYDVIRPGPRRASALLDRGVPVNVHKLPGEPRQARISAK